VLAVQERRSPVSGASFARAGVALAALALCAICWAWSLGAASHLRHGASVWPLFAMWAVMMAGMMIPPELPALVRLRPLQASVFAVGYLAPWVAFSFSAAAAHAALHGAGLLDHHMALVGHASAAAVLALAGICQLCPFKRRCLLRCRGAVTAPPGLLSSLGAGLASVASCGVLMLVLFATGVMNVAAMAALTLLLVLERTLPARVPVSTAAGVALLACAGWLAAAPTVWN
jgi:predicted metal-binding membrane protein